MIAVELVEDRERKTPAGDKATRIRDCAREKGVLIGQGGPYGTVLRIQPPLVIEKEQIDKALDILETIVAKILIL